MKNILVPIELHSSLDSVLTTAALLGDRLGARIEGLSLGLELPELVGFDLPVSWTAADQSAWADLIEEEHRRFEVFMQANGVPQRGTVPPGGISYGWSERSLTDSQVGSYARVFDLSVVGRPGSERGNPRMATVEGVLFDSGRPVVLAPPQAPLKLGETIVIAWTQNIESARTTALAMPLLALANKVVLLTITDHQPGDPLAGQMAEHLQADGIQAHVVTRSAKGRPLGQAWLDEATALGADLLIKGGYTRNRLRQMIFGDATSHILGYATLPVLMAS